MHRMILKAVDSRNATLEELAEAGIDDRQIPKDADGNPWKIAAHQAATVKALRHGTAPIIINEAMTGDGKTLAGRMPLFNDRQRSFVMYPTNELAHDQVQSFNELMDRWNPPAWGTRRPRERLINAREINAFSFGDGIDSSRMDELEAMMRQRDYILTNPDIFHLIMNFAYKQPGVAPDFLATFVANRFQIYIFDEFHLFGIEQTASVMIAMLLLRRLANKDQPPRFLFLSATPQNQLRHLAKRADLNIGESIQGCYEEGRSQTTEGFRRILRETSLSLYSGNLEDWVKEHADDIIKTFFLENQPAAKGVIIANSVATAHRIYAYLKGHFSGFIKVSLNTGLTPKADRTNHFDLLVATSTVDVGVDFKINFLVFESRDAASHIQRLGRLGRHAEDTNGNKFQSYEAHAVLPTWVIEGLMNAFPHDSSVSRREYKAKLEEYFSPPQQFANYVDRWAGIQAGKLLSELRSKDIYTQYRISREALEKEFKAIFGNSVRKYFDLAKASEKEKIKAASSFRGGSVFTALIQDPETESGEIVSYNLMTLLRRAELKAIPMNVMLQKAQNHGQNAVSLEKTNPLAAYELLGWRDDYREIRIRLDAELAEEKICEVIEQNRFSIDCQGIPELQTLNDTLYPRLLVTFIILNVEPQRVRQLLQLGLQTDLFHFIENAGLTGTVAFGRDALLIDSVYRRRKTHNAIFW